jgi:hypothetical protein
MTAKRIGLVHLAVFRYKDCQIVLLSEKDFGLKDLVLEAVDNMQSQFILKANIDRPIGLSVISSEWH